VIKISPFAIRKIERQARKTTMWHQATIELAHAGSLMACTSHRYETKFLTCESADVTPSA